MEVGPDWFRAGGRWTGPSDRKGPVVEWLNQRFGVAVEGFGKHHYQKELRWSTGARLWFDDEAGGPNEGTCCLELGGAALAQWDAAERLRRILELGAMGLEPKRLDLAVDLLGHGITIIQDIKDACERGELCHVRTYELVERRNQRGRWIAEGVNLGKRSSQGQYLCAYDKGLEQDWRKNDRGSWVRLEGRFHGAMAGYVLACLRQALAGGGVVEGFSERDGSPTVAAATWEDEAVRLVAGIADFRVRGRKGNRHLTRRARARWWGEFLGSVQVHRARGSSARTPSWYGFKKRFWERQVSPTIHGIMRRTGRSIAEVLADLEEDCCRVGGRPAVLAEYARAVAMREVAA